MINSHNYYIWLLIISQPEYDYKSYSSYRVFYRGINVIATEQIRKRITEAIQQSGMTQTAIANALNISQSTIAHYLKGDILPALDTFANLCKLLDVDTNYILCQE